MIDSGHNLQTENILSIFCHREDLNGLDRKFYISICNIFIILDYHNPEYLEFSALYSQKSNPPTPLEQQKSLPEKNVSIEHCMQRLKKR